MSCLPLPLLQQVQSVVILCGVIEQYFKIIKTIVVVVKKGKKSY